MAIITPSFLTSKAKQSDLGVEHAYEKLKNLKSNASLQTLSGALSKEFNREITCQFSEAMPVSQMVMAVVPNRSTLDKVLDYVADSESKIDAVMSIWQGSKEWTMEINPKILPLLTAQELTALTMHEMWHVIYTTKTVSRIKDTLGFMIGTSPIMTKVALTSKKFKKLIRLPGVISCQLVFNKNNIIKEAKLHKEYLKKELDADAFSASSGYRTHLISAIEKLDAAMRKEGVKANDAQAAGEFTLKVLDDLAERKYALANQKLAHVKGLNKSYVVTEEVDNIIESLFDGDIYMEDGEDLDHEIFMELGLFSNKLDPITNTQLDYAYVKAETMRTETDKIMILSYINSKIELANYYKSILKHPEYAKKYRVPHTMSELERIIATLESLRTKVLNMPFDRRRETILVNYPDNYQG